jgi:hypothetical protein
VEGKLDAMGEDAGDFHWGNINVQDRGSKLRNGLRQKGRRL